MTGARKMPVWGGAACFLAISVAATHAAEGETTPNPIQQTLRPIRSANEQWSVDLRLGFATLYKTEKAFSSIVVGDPKIIEVNALTDRTMTLVPMAVGLTNILFLDNKGEQVSGLQVLVTEAGPNRVKIHNKALLTSATIYRCAPTFCEYTDELTAKEPAPNPPTRQIVDQRIQTRGSGDVGVNVSAPPPPAQ
jgi:Flp pilus assembly secretin CpaC